MAEMQKNESLERFREGLLKAISRCRELAKAGGDRHFNMIAFNLEKILNQGMSAFNSKQLADIEINRLLNQIQKEIKV